MIPAATLGRAEAVHAATRYDRIFYGGMGVLLAAVAVAGFAPTFYLRSWFGAPPTVGGATELTPLAQIHGTVFTGWMVLFIIQTSLIASRRVAVHRRLGVAGVVLAVLMIVVGAMTAIAAARRGAAPPGAESLSFLVVPLMDLVLFAIFVTSAVLRRRDKETHKRLMLLAYVSIIAAGVARLPGVLPVRSVCILRDRLRPRANRRGLRSVVARQDPPRLLLGNSAAADLGARAIDALHHRCVALICRVRDPLKGHAGRDYRATQGARISCAGSAPFFGTNFCVRPY